MCLRGLFFDRSTNMKPSTGSVKLFIVCLLALASTAWANHKNCTTLDCSDLCNFHGAWINTTTDADGHHGYCICDDMHYTLASELENAEDHELVFCIHRRKQQLTAFALLCVPLTGAFGVHHWYLGHTGLFIAMLILGIFAGTSLKVWIYKNRLNQNTQFNISIVGASTGLAYVIWWLCDFFFLVLNNHYKDAHGQDLYAW